MSNIAVSTSNASRKLAFWLTLPVLLIAGGWAFMTYGPTKAAAPTAGVNKTHVIALRDIPVKINKDGELAAVNNIEIVSQVEGQTTIQTIQPEGANVKKDDIILTLDSSNIKQKIEDTTLEIQRAENDLNTSKEMKEIQENQNDANLDAAKVQLELADLDLKQYSEGTFPQQKKNAETDLEMAKINLKNQEEKLAQTKSLFLKNFVTATAVKDDQLSVTTAQNTLDKSQKALEVLKDYAHQMDETAKKSNVSQAHQNLVRTERQNASNLAQRNSDVTQKTQSLELLRRRLQRFEDQFAACTIKAPADGLVVYASSGTNERFNQQSPIQEGATVREQQRLIRLPDTTSMKVVVRINESQVGRLSEGLRARVRIVGIPNYLGATLTKISVLSDSGQRQFNPDVKEYPVDLTLDETPQGLKPGMGAVAEILLDQATGVTAVPLAAIYSAGYDAFVFVRDGDQFAPRKVRVGRTDDTFAELIGDTIKVGDEAILLQVGQGQELLDKAGIKVAGPTSQPGDGGFGRGRGRGRRGGGGGGGNGNGGGEMSAPDGTGAPGDPVMGGGGGRRGRGRRGGGPPPDGAPPDAPPGQPA